MELKDVKFGTGHIYYCSKHAARCVVVGSHCDDGAALFIELIKDDDLTSKYRLSEACYLTEVTVDLFPDRDTRPQCYAWAPGTYGHKCSECDKEFLGDKLASMCAPCAFGDNVKPGERRFKEKCIYPECNCPFDMGADNKCLRGLKR